MLSSQTQKGATLTFRHFNRKGYALFSCLGREVRVGVLGVATLLSATPRLMAATGCSVEGGDTLASYLDDNDTRLDEAVVSASRAPLATDVVARQVMTLTRRDLAAAGVTSINDVLKLAAGVDVRQRGGFGVQTDLSVDGGTFDQLTILVNGVAVNNPQSGHNAADFPLNLDDIERIEILQGAASRVFGSQAFSGAVNVVTRHGGSPLSLSVQGGSYGTLLAEGRTAWQIGPRFTTSASVGYRRSDGAVKNGSFSGIKAFWQGHYEDEAFKLETQAGITSQDFGANTFYSGAYPNQWEATRRYLLSAKAETKGRVHLVPQVSWLRNVDHYQLIHNTKTGENFNRSDVYTAGVNAWTSWAFGRTAVGAELREEGIYSTNLGRPMDASQHFAVPGEDGVFYTKHDSRTNMSYFVEHNVVLQQWTFSAGVMAQKNTAASRHFSFYPGVDVSYRPTQGVKIFVSWNKSMRLPTFTDLYYKSPTQEGNVGLRPEESSSFRLGASWNTRVVALSVDGHFNRGTNMIDWVMRSATDIYHATSFSLDNMGYSASVAVDFNQWLGKRQPLSRFTASYAYLHQHRRAGEDYFKSNYALEYLRHKFTASLSHRIISDLSALWTLRVQDREGAYLRYENGISTGELHPYGAHALLDCRVSWTQPHYDLFVDMTNLTSHRYYDLANVRQPGFMLMGGVKVRL